MPKITYVAPHTAHSCVMRTRFGKRWVEFLGLRDGSWKDLATTERNMTALGGLLDGRRDDIAAAFRG